MKLEDIANTDRDYKLVKSYDSEELKVVLITDETRSSQKYIHAIDDNDKEYIISLPYDEFCMHRYIKSALQRDLNDSVYVPGGGWIEYDNDNELELCRSSGDFGRADHCELSHKLKKLGVKATC